MGFHFFKRPIGHAGARTYQGGGALASTGLALTKANWSTSISLTLAAPFKTSGTRVANRVVKLTSQGTVIHTTGSSGRKILGVLQSTGSTAMVVLHGITLVQKSSAAIKRGQFLAPSSGSIQTSRFNGGCVKASANNTVNNCGIALTSGAASSATVTLILAYINPMGRASTAA